LGDGEFAGLRDTPDLVDDPEAFFQLILRQLPADVRLGTGGNFPGGESIAGRIVTLREQIAELVRSERAQVFDALIADEAEVKTLADMSDPSPFLPLWKPQPRDRSAVVNGLLALYPDIHPKRFEALVEQFPLSDAQTQDFLDEDELPDPFLDVLEQSIDEWRKDRGLDGVFHTRTYNPEADELAREFAERLLKERFDYELIITEPWQSAYQPDGADDTAIVLVHDGRGNFGRHDLRNGGVDAFRAGTDSFYQAIGLALQPHERVSLGMQSENDVAGLRSTLGNLAATAEGGWYDPVNHIQVKNDLLPSWMKEASVADKLLWSDAWEDYRQALSEAQTPDFPDITQYGDPQQLRSYARTELELRLSVELGLSLNPDDIIVETTESIWTGSSEAPPDLDVGVGLSASSTGDGGFEYTITRRSLTQVCLDNLRLEDSDFWLTARFLDSKDRPIMALSKNYVHGLVRELNVGDSYVQFLEQRLLTSPFGQWSRDRYAQVMATQMRLDAIETKMAMGFLEDGKSPPNQADRGYKWVRAVLDHPMDDGNRALVEGHRIRVQNLVLQYASARESLPITVGTVPVHEGTIPGLSRPAGVPLEGLLIIGPESRLSVPGIVIYTPMAPAGVQFREFSSHEEMERHLLGDALLRNYLIGRAPVELQAQVRRALDNVDLRSSLVFTAQPPVTSDFYLAQYEAEVRKVIALVDAQTTSTSEANWNSAWNFASTLAELALEFAPFKIALPIAAARSLYAFSQGGRALANGDGSAGLHFTQAVLLLADGLPGAKRAKLKLPSSSKIDPKTAARIAPNGLQLRTDGIYNGVYEKSKVGGASDFFIKDAGKTFLVRYDTAIEYPVWRIIDGRNPAAGHRMPVVFDGHVNWLHAPYVRGGVWPRAGRGNPPPENPGPSAPAPVAAGTKTRVFDMDDFYQSKQFRDLGDDDKAMIVKTVDNVRQGFTNGKLHQLRGLKNVWSLDLSNLEGSGSGRGKWRLLLTKEGGVFKATGVGNTHKG
jgi:hypothetical protein